MSQPPDRIFPRISLRDFDRRSDQVTKELVDAAKGVGFFIVTDHGIAPEEIGHMFELSKRYFALSDETKAKNSFIREKNVGWEKETQIRPSTGTPDQKESLQLQWTRANMEGKWPSDDDVPGFRTDALRFMARCQDVSLRIMSCFADALAGRLPAGFFDEAHDVRAEDCLTVLRCLHYHDITGVEMPEGYWRAGAHTDFDVLTLLFQREGESGLEVCPGREASTSFGWGDTWYPVPPEPDHIVCNVGDMLMYLSDDVFKSNFHRVRAPRVGENQGPRYSLAYFNQASRGTRIGGGGGGKYEELTGEEFILRAMRRNYEAGERMRKGKNEKEMERDKEGERQ